MSKMTTTCKDCDHVFGAWRPRCPACGTLVDPQVRRAMLEDQRAATQPARKKREREPRPDECTFCRRRGAKDKCPHCEERIHAVCMRLHEEPCKRFQTERVAAANNLERPADVASFVSARLKP